MREIDEALLEAWSVVSEKLRRDPAMARARLERVLRPTVARPLRAWCVALRANDTRIVADWNALIEPRPGRVLEAHGVTLFGSDIRKLLEPVRLGFVGARSREVAARLGVSEAVLRRWAKEGKIGRRHDPPSCHGGRGKPRPILYSSSPLDPNHAEGDAPEEVWGTLWQHHHENFPLEFEQTIRRVPRYRPWREYDAVARGWNWVCPGGPRPRPRKGRGEAERCGRLCTKLYFPLPTWTVARYMGYTEPLPFLLDLVPKQHHPPLPPPPPEGAPLPGFACAECWGVQFLSVTKPHEAWNQFVTHVSAGLLFGREVERPEGVCETPRRHVYREKGWGKEAVRRAVDEAEPLEPRDAG